MDGQTADARPLYRFALEVEYDGSSYSGWQRQFSPQLPTVQGYLEEALSRVADAPITVFCAGRTDRGVHATGQVVHFESPVERSSKAWVLGTNSGLPVSIRVRWAQPVSVDFHARFSALARRYLYLIYEEDLLSTHLFGRATRVADSLNIEAMQQAGRLLEGEHDFSAFRAAGCQSNSPWRCVHWLRVLHHHRFIVVDIQANAFLQHMVRNIVGMLLEVGKGAREPDWAGELLSGRDRTAGAMTAPAHGLYLVRASYPGQFNLPESSLGPLFLQPYP